MRQTRTRREFLKEGAASAAALAVAARARGAETAPRRPNIVIIMADDMGYSDIGCYGGEIATPNLDGLAAGGLRFTQFYNNAKCAPTRASLLTGLYAQQAGVMDGPVVMKNCVTLAEVLRGAGYRTLMSGKWHAQQLPVERGFDRYYGLTDGCCNYFNPGEQRPGEPKPAEANYPRKWAIDGTAIQPFTPEDPDFYSTDAFTDHALEFLDATGVDDQPFFLYLAYTAPHYPLQARPEDIAKYRGKYLAGWDELRRQRYERMVKMGIIEERWGLSPRDERVPAWDNVGDESAWPPEALGGERGLTPEEARDRDLWDLRMAVYAAMVDRMDQNIGRLIEKLEASGEIDNTLILFLADNGGCAEFRNITHDVPPGPVNSYRTVDPPWANAQNTPFKKFKRWDHEGGISTPLIAHWPGTIQPGTLTNQVGHLIDFMPTCLELAGAEYPGTHAGENVLPYEGKSLLPVFEGRSREGHEALYWQFGVCRAMRQGKWKLVKADQQPWELYDMEADRTEIHDLASAHPDRVEAMASAWDHWSTRCRQKT